MSNRRELLERIIAESQRNYAAYVLFNQAMADRLGLHPTDLQCVALLDLESGPVTTGHIARLTGLTPGSASRLVDRLEKAGLAVREADPADRRRALVSLAPGVRDRIGRAWDEPGSAYAEVLGGYTDGELELIAGFLRRTTEVGLAQAERLASADR
ncbi:MarR family winged helix-turn-helix transcriptional regulator [Nonomuraea muscovyensis]|uniref:DNA-binding MarR family transcriptional regulator n=1 Tax=Nonomuraea muscovyensis TaxID=1124761 RepID=A0A7X0C5X2_9ACTN|nr:MarR family transcriptional regulator [Nonomuraea muscovyensis]MBB6348226.1 DNA-binding MarR family transcriptional regulator [Nonomuraea muscovyensis]